MHNMKPIATTKARKTPFLSLGAGSATLYPVRHAVGLGSGFLRQQGVAGLGTKCLKVLDGVRVCGDHTHHLAGLQDCQGLFGAENGQRAFQPAGVNFGIGLVRPGWATHDVTCNCWSTQTRMSSRAAGRSATDAPPPMAMSGLPPPLPPTCDATLLTSSPALTCPVRSGVTPATRLIRP